MELTATPVGHREMVPEPAITMICERNLLVPLHTGCASTSSIVVVMLKPPLIPRYKPVPEPL